MDILNDTRIGFSDDEDVIPPCDQGSRSAFHADIDRIIFSDAFRRLQDKTQVHGPAGNDYVRSRLTHSMEVSVVGRNLGEIFGNILCERAPDLAPGRRPIDFGAVTSAACLMHDIGNPPFGHTGEKAISEFFTNTATGQEVIRRLFDHPLATEAKHFEGNAQGLRTVAKLSGWRPGSGLRLTAATISGFCKYPFPVTSPRSAAKKHKYGFFKSEHECFSTAAGLTGMHGHEEGGWRRHAIAYLVEAADDSCYRIVDIEDGYVMNCLSFDEAEGLLLSVAGDPGRAYQGIETKTKKLTRLRSLAITNLVSDLKMTLAKSFDDLVRGTHQGDLLLQGQYRQELTLIDHVSRKKIYGSPERLRTDLQAHKVISTLLDTYLAAFMERQDGRPSAWADTVLKSFPHSTSVGRDPEFFTRSVLDYVAGMTDDYAMTQSRLFATPARKIA